MRRLFCSVQILSYAASGCFLAAISPECLKLKSVLQRTDYVQNCAYHRSCTASLKISADEFANSPGRCDEIHVGDPMQTERLMVTGMTCGGCINKVSRALTAVSGVDHVKVSLAAGDATVRFNEQLTSVDQLKSAVKNAGYAVDGTVQSKAGCCG
jgi:copper chaperone